MARVTARDRVQNMLDNGLVYFECEGKYIDQTCLCLYRMDEIEEDTLECTAAIVSIEPPPPFAGFHFYLEDNDEGFYDWLVRNKMRRSFRPLTEEDVAWGHLQDRWGRK